MNENKKAYEIFKVFLKIGIILLGGGYVIIPILKREIVEKRNWLNEDELCNFYCMSQCLSGIIAINTSILVGYKLAKLKGAIAAVLGISFSPFLSIIIIANLLNQIMAIPFIKGLFFGINLSVIILIYLTLADIWKKSVVDILTLLWFLLILFLALFKVSPVLLILLSIFAGILVVVYKKIEGKR